MDNGISTGEFLKEKNQELKLEYLNADRDGGGDSTRKAWLRALEKTASIVKNPAVTLPVLIDGLAARFEDAPALVSEHQTLTYRGLAVRSHQYSRWALQQGVKPHDVVCLLMPNCPEYLAIWLGIIRVGAIVSLINTNLGGDALLHAINIVAPKHVIVDATFAESLASISQRMPAAIRNWAYGDGGRSFSRIDDEIEGLAKLGAVAKGEYHEPPINDRALYIYTSGTTGLPKAANVSHFRLMQWSTWFAGMMDTRADDRTYNCLPMYHSVGGVVAIGSTLVNGGSVVIRQRFSATRFWDDVVESKCTIFQYIGELCRYLVNTEPHPRESEHGLRLACGNGMTAEVWEKFQRRFHVPRILEFYAATEGNFSLYNCEGRVGAVGRIPSFLAQRQSVAVVKFDPERGEPIRNDDGRCLRCANNEPGEAIGKISSDEAASSARFEGYADEAASEKKILHDVFAPGDSWFRTGDLMRRDEKGFFYFVDRIGDTFRWKGENVSTTEIAATICKYDQVAEAVVYGVTIPGAEGRAGMVAAVVRENFDLGGFRDHLTEHLPPYARPLFIRICGKLDMTGTFKARKTDLVREAYDPAATADALYFYDPRCQEFVSVDAEVFARIQSGEMRF
jgi:fatty-acyl-CoA synthase